MLVLDSMEIKKHKTPSHSCSPVVLISLKFFPMLLTPGLSLHHCHPDFGETLQYDMANGLAIDFVSENGRWRKCPNWNIWKGTKYRGIRYSKCLHCLLFYLPAVTQEEKVNTSIFRYRAAGFYVLYCKMTTLL